MNKANPVSEQDRKFLGVLDLDEPLIASMVDGEMVKTQVA